MPSKISTRLSIVLEYNAWHPSNSETSTKKHTQVIFARKYNKCNSLSQTPKKRATMPWPEQWKIRNSQQTPDLKLLFGLTVLLYCSKCCNISLDCLGNRMPASKSAHTKHISHPSLRKQWSCIEEPWILDKRNTYSTHVISRFVDNDWSITGHACMMLWQEKFINNELNGWL